MGQTSSDQCHRSQQSHPLKECSDGAIASQVRAVISSSDSLEWQLGDALHELEKRHPIEQKGGCNDQWLNIFCREVAIHEKRRAELIAVCSFYPPANRRTGLSFAHHRDAMLGSIHTSSSPTAAADAFLTHALLHHFTPSQLRQHIRKASRIHSTQPTRSNLSSYAPVFAFRRFATQEVKAKNKITKQRAQLILSDLGNDVTKFIDNLKRIASS